jgi:hypothetical protein
MITANRGIKKETPQGFGALGHFPPFSSYLRHVRRKLTVNGDIGPQFLSLSKQTPHRRDRTPHFSALPIACRSTDDSECSVRAQRAETLGSLWQRVGDRDERGCAAQLAGHRLGDAGCLLRCFGDQSWLRRARKSIDQLRQRVASHTQCIGSRIGGRQVPPDTSPRHLPAAPSLPEPRR